MVTEETHGLAPDQDEPASQAGLSLSAALRARTVELHTQAERSGIVNDILHGKATRHGYAMLLRNLVPAYDAMEQGFERHRGSDAIGHLARREMYRSAALQADLAALCGDDWVRTLPLLSAGKNYRKRVVEAARGDGARLIAHAYARYLGDLSGGQILKKLLGRSLALQANTLTFYDFPRIMDAAAFKAEFRHALDQAGDRVPDFDAVVEEAAVAFQLNIDVSDAVRARTKI